MFALYDIGSALRLVACWQAAKVICSAKISIPGANGDPAPAVNQADFCPSDASVICVTGDKILRFFRVTDAQLKPLPLNLKMELQVYTAHCWLGDEQVGRAISPPSCCAFN